MTYNILLIEDRYEDVLQTIEALDEFGQDIHTDIKIETTMDGADALDYLYCRGQFASRPHHNPELIILDLKLPKINGFELLKKIKFTPSTQTIPVVVLTILKGQEIVDTCIKLKADDLIIKPMEHEDFRNAIREMGKNWILPRLH